jgi:hypothetical protein
VTQAGKQLATKVYDRELRLRNRPTAHGLQPPCVCACVAGTPRAACPSGFQPAHLVRVECAQQERQVTIRHGLTNGRILLPWEKATNHMTIRLHTVYVWTCMLLQWRRDVVLDCAPELLS